jgi:hypothetical protein
MVQIFLFPKMFRPPLLYFTDGPFFCLQLFGSGFDLDIVLSNSLGSSTTAHDLNSTLLKEHWLVFCWLQ